ncbi:MAG: isocitrate lyase/phosphoenolpyruvate mutase family protein [Acidobacteriota bacterium]
MSSSSSPETFASLHVPGRPLVLYNAWDVASAVAIAEAGARAVATSSSAVAASQGHADGEDLPFEVLHRIAERIVGAVDLPVTVDLETGYGASAEAVGERVGALVDLGVVGVNLEDRLLDRSSLRTADDQAERLGAARAAADRHEREFFINARTDVFFQGAPPDRHEGLLDAAIARAETYRRAGASGLFVPGLLTPALIERLCAAVELPINIMAVPDGPSRDVLAACGVARISHGPFPLRAALETLREAARAAIAPAA